MNRTVRRTLVAGALALPLTLGAAGIASADTYTASTATAGPAGASHSSIYSSTGSNPHYAGGSATYYRENASATEDGASSDYTYAAADSRGGVRYAHGENTAGPEGATSSHVSASAGGGHRNHHHHSPGLRGGRER
ncbi:hypothetical protein G3I59_45220 [Amycolatopsis rubida]|uniref:Uncharacterized protein n=1 Tax=Amycolatopsis rubida TaxID=112413 RepID=A0ABX0C4B6_9PSEU|nr:MULTISPECIES: hypothetical protein [Amycolatopsis]MYW97629.1 hypothetical protein [Amycolatopsis rubida]NEC62614.1 hypothetical protein [Amycolatopsis rubida]OAP21799.1 hypothetical protein A4R44_07256 [Amycolatopsis sp. M39]